MTCIHGLGSSVVYYVIYDIPLSNKLINFNIFNDHEPNSYHQHLITTLNIVMNSDPKDENYNGQKHLIFDKTKTNLILHDLRNDLSFI